MWISLLLLVLLTILYYSKFLILSDLIICEWTLGTTALCGTSVGKVFYPIAPEISKMWFHWVNCDHYLDRLISSNFTSSQASSWLSCYALLKSSLKYTHTPHSHKTYVNKIILLRFNDPCTCSIRLKVRLVLLAISRARTLTCPFYV